MVSVRCGGLSGTYPGHHGVDGGEVGSCRSSSRRCARRRGSDGSSCPLLLTSRGTRGCTGVKAEAEVSFISGAWGGDNKGYKLIGQPFMCSVTLLARHPPFSSSSRPVPLIVSSDPYSCCINTWTLRVLLPPRPRLDYKTRRHAMPPQGGCRHLQHLV